MLKKLAVTFMIKFVKWTSVQKQNNRHEPNVNRDQTNISMTTIREGGVTLNLQCLCVRVRGCSVYQGGVSTRCPFFICGITYAPQWHMDHMENYWRNYQGSMKRCRAASIKRTSVLLQNANSWFPFLSTRRTRAPLSPAGCHHMVAAFLHLPFTPNVLTHLLESSHR